MKEKRNVTLLILSVLLCCLLLINASSTAQSKPTLYWGSKGNAVKEVQQRLSNWYYYRGKVDGIYGPVTFGAVKSFQRKNGLNADGVVGPQTWKALGISVASAKKTTSTTYKPTKGVSASDDITLLARAIHAEAEAEPYIGKVAVGAVILNRVANAQFPNSLSGVIYQGRALESVANGRVNSQPNNDSIKAARDALNGWDPTYGALYFWNPSKPVSAWIWTRKIVVKYGAHVFGN